MKKHIGRSVCLVAIAALLLTGCGQKKETVSVTAFETPQYEWGTVSNRTITIWGDDTDLKRPYQKKAFERYQEITGNTLEIRYLSKQEMSEEVPAAFQCNTAQKPDILLSYGGINLDNLKPEENFYDFTGAQWVEDLTDTALNQTIYNGKVIGLPHGEASVSGMLYNKKIFKAYDLEIPRTQEEFMQVCAVLYEKGVTPVYLPNEGSTMLLCQFPMDSFTSKSEILEGLNNNTLSYTDIPEMKTIVQWYRTMAQKGYFGDSYADNNWEGMSSAMSSERYAMMICWDTWLYTDFEGDASQFGLMPAFIGVPEEGCFEGPNQMLLLASKNSVNLDAALDLITFMADPYNYNIDYEGIYTAPIFKNQVGSISTPQYVEADRLIEQHFYDSVTWLRLKGFSQVDAAYIQRYMQETDYTADACLRDMDNARKSRAAGNEP